jgi:hypothetical protein
MMRDPSGELTEPERARLTEGYHDDVARELDARGRPDLAGWVREQIWDWEGAVHAYRAAGRALDVLRVAIESGASSHLDLALRDIESGGDAETIDAAIALLQRRRRSMEAARLLALRKDAVARARALVRAGDRLGAARVLAEADHPREALDVLTAEGELHQPEALSLAATLSWDLGNAEGAARLAQYALRNGADDDATRDLLSRALAALGHHLAAQMVAPPREVDALDEAVPGRYRVTGLGLPGLVGAAYAGFDRVTLQEVEIHLLLAEQPDGAPIDTEVLAALERFAAVAVAATQLGHPAIRPILRLDPRAGLLVLPQAAGPSLRTLIRPPGMLRMASRARALCAFMLEGLAVAHRRGLVHGWLLPSQIGSDALGRPLLGPFGAHHLAGLAATHTGGLEEIMMITAPELRRGGVPRRESDLYALGAILRALLTGRLSGVEPEDEDSPELELARRLTATDPDARPDVREALRVLRAPVADVRELESVDGDDPASRTMVESKSGDLEIGVEVVAAESWSDAWIEALCRASAPWLQPILDREGRRFVLAPWPAGSVGLDDSMRDRWRTLLPEAALELGEPELEAAIGERLAPSTLVRTPSGAWMLALDDLLTR